jgi:hypothetical protein
MTLRSVLGLMVGWTIMSASPAQQAIPLSKTRTVAIVVPAPANLTVSRTASGIRLSWRDHSNGKAAFKIERKTGDQGTYQEIATTDPGKTTYDDPTEAGKTCHYRIRAFVGAGKAMRYSAYSNEAVLNVARLERLNPAIVKGGLATPVKVLTIPSVINAPGTLTVTGGQPPAAPTAVLTIPAVINPPGTMTVTGGTAKVATAILTIPITINPAATLTVTGKNPE